MKVKPKQQILFYDGKPLSDQDGNPVILRDVIVNAINFVDPNEKQDSSDKSRVFEISLKMFKEEEEVDLDTKERAFILEKAEKALVPITYGRLKEILEE
jgi:hypothetical protein